MVIKVCITEKPGGFVDLSISPELSNYPLDYSNMKPYSVESIDVPRDMVGEMVQKYLDSSISALL